MHKVQQQARPADGAATDFLNRAHHCVFPRGPGRQTAHWPCSSGPGRVYRHVWTLSTTPGSRNFAWGSGRIQRLAGLSKTAPLTGRSAREWSGPVPWSCCTQHVTAVSGPESPYQAQSVLSTQAAQPTRRYPQESTRCRCTTAALRTFVVFKEILRPSSLMTTPSGPE